MMIAGATLVGLQLAAIAFGPAWKIQFLSLLLMGWGFYMIHGCLQVFASELSVEARATALSLHSFFFFMGQTIGPIAYGFGSGTCGKMATLLAAACVMIALGFVCAQLLRQRGPPTPARHESHSKLSAIPALVSAALRSLHPLLGEFRRVRRRIALVEVAPCGDQNVLPFKQRLVVLVLVVAPGAGFLEGLDRARDAPAPPSSWLVAFTASPLAPGAPSL